MINVSTSSCATVPSTPATQDDTLTTFYERGLESRNWQIFHKDDPIRVLYVGHASSNLHQLVNAEGLGNKLHYPFPAIKPPLPWRPEYGADEGSYLSQAAIRDIGSLPTQDVRDALVETFFHDIHPGFPIIDAQRFLRQYQDPEDMPPLLLFHAILLAAARISDHPLVAASRAAVTGTLYRRARTLFELRHENDRVHLVQAALLLTWHSESADTIAKNAWYWIAQAVRIGYGLGMHRDLSAASPSTMPDADKREYRRCWWASLQMEAFAALKFGRPSMIRHEDYDQPPLSLDDCLSYDGSDDSTINQEFCILNSEIAEVALKVLASHAPRSTLDPTAIDEQLVNIEARLPPSHDFWSCQLRLNYSMVALTALRTREDFHSLLLSQEAASTILTTFETMITQASIRKCQPCCAPTLFAATIEFAKGVRSGITTGARLRALTAHAQLERLLRPVEVLAEYWPNIRALQKLCITLHDRCSRMVLDNNVEAPNLTAGESEYVHMSLEDLMAGFDLPGSDFDFGAGDWMTSI